MKFIQRLADGHWVSGQTKGFDLYTGWVDLKVENLSPEKQVWVDFTVIQSLMGQETVHEVSIPATFKEPLPDNKERWSAHTPEFLPVMELPGMLSYTKEASYRARLIVEGQEITDLERHALFVYHPKENANRETLSPGFPIPSYAPEDLDLYQRSALFNNKENHQLCWGRHDTNP